MHISNVPPNGQKEENEDDKKKFKKIIAQTRNRTGGPTMATLDFTTKPFAPFVEIVSMFLIPTTPDFVFLKFKNWCLPQLFQIAEG